MYLSLYYKGSKRVTQGFTVRGSWRPNRTAIYWAPHSYGRQRCVFLVLQGCSTGGPEAHSAGFLYYILSPTGLRNNGGPDDPFGRLWLSVSHLISNFSDPQLSDVPVLTELYNSSTSTQSPTQSWNGMFDRHQAEITVMQFTGHSLPVHQSMSVPLGFLPCPISSAKPTYAISFHNCHWNVSLPSGAPPLEWQIWLGGRSKYTNQIYMNWNDKK